jgi:peptide/nickel transport system substrate-binding protein
VDAEIKKVFSSRDPQERAAVYSQIAKKVYDEAATVFLVHETLHDAYSSKLTNFRSHPLNYYMLTPSLSIQ